ncbi:MAG: hypothetical protein JSS66_06090 [Armatimonadetes bacterium]|nr:hypothetical protein [Armatimonadota bacterium]
MRKRSTPLVSSDKRNQHAVTGIVLSALDQCAQTIERALFGTFRDNDSAGMNTVYKVLAALAPVRQLAVSGQGPVALSIPTPSVSEQPETTPRVRRRKTRQAKKQTASVPAPAAESSTAPSTPKRRRGRPRKTTATVRPKLSEEERLRRAKVKADTLAGVYTDAKTYLPYLLKAIHELGGDTGVDFQVAQVKMREMMEGLTKPGDEETIGGSHRTRWMAQTAALRRKLLMDNLIAAKPGAGGEATYVLTPAGMEAAGIGTGTAKDKGGKKKTAA